MSTPIHAVVTDTFVSDGAAKTLSIPSGYTKFEMFNITDLGDDATVSVMHAEGTSSMPAGSALFSIGAGGGSLLTPGYTNTNGFTFISDSASVSFGSLVALNGTEISQAATAVASTATTTNLVAGKSVVRFVNTTGMLQIDGVDFTVGTVNAGANFQVKYLDTQAGNGFTAPASGGSYRIVNADPRFYPKRRFITKMTSSGLNTVIVLSVTHQFTIGQSVRLIIPTNYGMSSLNSQLCKIVDIDTVNNTITVNVDSSSAGTFAWPASAVAFAGNFAQVVPVGEAATTSAGVVNPSNLLDDATVNESYTGISIGTAVQTSGKSYQWIATKGVSIT